MSVRRKRGSKQKKRKTPVRRFKRQKFLQPSQTAVQAPLPVKRKGKRAVHEGGARALSLATIKDSIDGAMARMKKMQEDKRAILRTLTPKKKRCGKKRRSGKLKKRRCAKKSKRCGR